MFAVGLSSLLLAVAAAPDPETISIAFGGDVHGEGHVQWELEAHRNPFDGVAGELSAADIAVVNLETVVGEAGEPSPKRFRYRSTPRLLRYAAEAGVDVVNLANNHAWDFGADGLRSTLAEVSRAKLIAVGAGHDRRAAEAPALITVRGTTVAIVGMARVELPKGARAYRGRLGVNNGFAGPRMRRAVRDAAAAADVVVATVHMGREERFCPAAHDLAFVDELFEAGASVVVGHHPHRIQTIEHEEGHLAAYSVGNLVFDARNSDGQESGVLTVDVKRDGTVGSYRWTPARITDGVPALLEGEAAANAQQRLAARRRGGGKCK